MTAISRTTLALSLSIVLTGTPSLLAKDSKSPATCKTSSSERRLYSQLDIGHYTPWGIDEYELFGLTRAELASKFKNKLFFKDDFHRAEMCQEGTGLGYQGPVFNLNFKNDRVDSVQGVFEGCTKAYSRPIFTSKEAALRYAVDELSRMPNPAEQQKLAKAKAALEELQPSKSKNR